MAPTHASEPSSCATVLATASSDSFRKTLNRVLELAGIDESTKSKIQLAAQSVDVREAEIEANQIQIRRPWLSRRIGRLILRWPTQKNLERASDSVLMTRLAEVIGVLLVKRATRFGVYKDSQRAFIKQNIDALTLKLFIQHKANAVEPLRVVSSAGRIFQIVLNTLLPMQRDQIRTLQLDQHTEELFKAGGPSAVFQYLRRYYGPPLALKYWIRHAKNLGAILSLSVMIYIAPTAADTWQMMRQESSIQIPTEDRQLAQEIMRHFKKTDLQMIDEIKTRANDSVILDQFLKSFETELQIDPR